VDAAGFAPKKPLKPALLRPLPLLLLLLLLLLEALAPAEPLLDEALAPPPKKDDAPAGLRACSPAAPLPTLRSAAVGARTRAADCTMEGHAMGLAALQRYAAPALVCSTASARACVATSPSAAAKGSRCVRMLPPAEGATAYTWQPVTRLNWARVSARARR